MTAMALGGEPRTGGMTSEQRLVIFASSLGTVFEWYDFYIYGTLAVFLAKYFFSNVPANVAFIFTLLAFAAGFAVRPFGALIFGRLGDFYGRKPFVIASIVVFTAASVLCGMANSMLFLVIARALQGIGGGMLVGTAFACIPDLFPEPRVRLRLRRSAG